MLEPTEWTTIPRKMKPTVYVICDIILAASSFGDIIMTLYCNFKCTIASIVSRGNMYPFATMIKLSGKPSLACSNPAASIKEASRSPTATPQLKEDIY